MDSQNSKKQQETGQETGSDPTNRIPEDIQAALILHIGKDFLQIDKDGRLMILERKKNRYRLMIGVNLFALLFFTYSFLGGLTQLSMIIYYVLGTVFVVNMLMISHQRKQLLAAIDFVKKLPSDQD